MHKLKLLPALALVAAVVGSTTAAEADDAAKVEYFEKHVRPILARHCSACHSAETKPAGGLRVDDRNGLVGGGNSGAAIVPGQPDKSLLLKRVTQDGKRRMPLEGEALTADQIDVLTRWIKDGAAWPSVRVPASLGKIKPYYEKLKKEHWAWQPVGNPAVPNVQNTAWPRSDIDRFVLAALETKNLRPVADADRATLIRRVTFDLTGLPPTTAEIDAFSKDESVDAYDKLVDRLLGSSAFGEQWGRHWLDVARYGESTGPSRNIPYPHAWRYRDYVIDAINADVPFNRFIQEQIAGDLLPGDSDKERDRLKSATGFLALGVKDVNQRFKIRFQMDNVDEQIDVVTRSVLGLTVSCARCHDHKFDPVPITDYYSLAGIFTSTENAAGLRNQMGGGGLAYYVPDLLLRLSGELPPADPKVVERLQAEAAEAKKAWDAIRGTPEGLKTGTNGAPVQRAYRLKYDSLQGQLLDLTDPARRGLVAHGVRDAATVSDTEVRLRGEAEKLGPVAPRGFLTTFPVPGAAAVNAQQSGRLELAQWLTSDRNPLTARVFVNRAWQHLFGRGLVGTVDNFGVTGDVPSHPELLDHLANTFRGDGWSVKKLVRRLVLTRAYQLGSDATADDLARDPANKLLWRHAPRRLTAEELRDAMLAAAGTLDAQRPSGSVVQSLRMVEIRDNGPEAKGIREKANAATHRSVYLPQVRGLIPTPLEAFDPVEQTLVTGTRDATTVAGQALYLLNGTFVRKQALALAERVLKAADAAPADRIRQTYRLTLGRQPTAAEIERASKFLTAYEAAYRAPEAEADAPAPKRDPDIKPEEQPANPDLLDQAGLAVTEEVVRPKDARTAAWLAFAQALFASAEYRYTR